MMVVLNGSQLIVLMRPYLHKVNPLVPGGLLRSSHGEEHVVHPFLLAWCKLLPAVVHMSAFLSCKNITFQFIATYQPSPE